MTLGETSQTKFILRSITVYMSIWSNRNKFRCVTKSQRDSSCVPLLAVIYIYNFNFYKNTFRKPIWETKNMNMRVFLALNKTSQKSPVLWKSNLWALFTRHWAKASSITLQQVKKATTKVEVSCREVERRRKERRDLVLLTLWRLAPN